MAKVSLSFRIDSERKEALQARADEMDMSLADFLRDGAELLGDLDLLLWKRVLRLSETLNISPSKVLQNIVLEQFAIKDARSERTGTTRQSYEMFPFDDEGLITGNTLFELRKRHHRTRSYKNKISWLRGKIQNLEIRLEKERGYLAARTYKSEDLEMFIAELEVELSKRYADLMKEEARLAEIEEISLGFTEQDND